MSEAELDEMLDAIRAEIGVEPQQEMFGHPLWLGPIPRPANDNGLSSRMIPFPDGWFAIS